MSANLDLVRSIYAEWERGDYRSTAWAHPDIEYVIADGPAPGSWTALAHTTRIWREWLDAWADFRVQAEGYRELDDECVFVLLHVRGRGKTSGLELEGLRTQSATLWHIRGGKVTRIVFYFDRERALADLGLEA